MKAESGIQIEPIAVGEKNAAVLLGVSPRLVWLLVKRGDLRPVTVPGFRRRLFLVSELRALVGRWASAPADTPEAE